MTTEYRIIFTGLFSSVIERDKAYTALKNIVQTLAASATFKRADISTSIAK